MVKHRGLREVSSSPIIFQLSCGGCSSRFEHSHSKDAPFCFSEESKGRALDVRDLLGGSAAQRGRRRPGREARPGRWGAAHMALVRVLVDLFGEESAVLRGLLPDFSEGFLRKKLEGLRKKGGQPGPSRAWVCQSPQPAQPPEEKETPERSTAERPPPRPVWPPSEPPTPFQAKFVTPNSLVSRQFSASLPRSEEKRLAAWGHPFEDEYPPLFLTPLRKESPREHEPFFPVALPPAPSNTVRKVRPVIQKL